MISMESAYAIPETIRQMSDDPLIRLPVVARSSVPALLGNSATNAVSYTTPRGHDLRPGRPRDRFSTPEGARLK